jgi:phage portal protein BeeE
MNNIKLFEVSRVMYKSTPELKQYIANCNIKQKDIAKAMGVTEEYVYDILKNRRNQSERVKNNFLNAVEFCIKNKEHN